jgi:UDP-N-acetylmuramate dehydrogenase
MSLVITDQVPLAPHTTLELGGPAEHFARIEDRASLLEALHWAKSRALPVTVLGGGSNVVVSDRGVAGLVLQLRTRGVSLTHDAEQVCINAEAGEDWDGVVARSVAENLAGLECLSGIPGSVGATPIQNVGAYGQEVANCLQAVEVLERSTLQTSWLRSAACEFGYRSSRFKREAERFIVLSVRFALAPGGAASLRYAELARALAAVSSAPSLAEVRAAVLQLRRAKSMLLEPHDENRRSVGSFFLNPVVSAQQAGAIATRARELGLLAADQDLPSYPQADGSVKLSAAWLIEHSGTVKGERQGAVGVSSRHALALVHHGGARSAELIALARTLRERTRNRFGLLLDAEPVMLGFEGSAL